ncbi:hypothetical protein HZC34_08165 [Candidatus Saganbacteria bacterium]|nr:hypothetical protein [Candidatus Saganbacteria bacterium]
MGLLTTFAVRNSVHMTVPNRIGRFIASSRLVFYSSLTATAAGEAAPFVYAQNQLAQFGMELGLLTCPAGLMATITGAIVIGTYIVRQVEYEYLKNLELNNQVAEIREKIKEATPEELRAFSTHPLEGVRSEVARCERTPHNVLEKLAYHSYLR